MIVGTVRIWVSGALACAMLAAACSVPHRMTRKEDVAAREWNDPAAAKRVLIASRSSQFKNEVVKRVEETLRQDEDVYVRVTGVETLAQEDLAPYGAVVLVNACMAWTMDPAIASFLERHPGDPRLIVLTTSADGEWEPGKERQAFDTVTAASAPYDPGAAADEIVEKVRRLLEAGPRP